MIEIRDLGFGVIEIFDKDTQYAPAQSIKIGNTTYIREDLINKQIADLQHRLEVAEKALELACERVKYFEELQDKEMGHFEFFGYDTDYDLKAIIEQYKQQAKEMLENE